MGSRNVRSHGERGATLLIALVALLVAAMVSVVITDAALTAAQRVTASKAQVQDYLDVSSAAEVLARCFEESECTISYTTTVTYTKEDESSEIQSSLSETDKTCSFTAGSALGPLLARALEYVALTSGDSASYSVSGTALTLAPGQWDGKDVVPPVSVTDFTLAKPGDPTDPAYDSSTDYLISGVLSAASAGELGQRIVFQAKLANGKPDWEGSVQDNRSGDGIGTVVTTHTMTFRWNRVTFETRG